MLKGMMTPSDTPRGHAAEVSVKIGKSVTFDAGISAAGLLSLGALVSGILLSSAVIVSAGKRRSDPVGRPRLPLP
jgi:hypothetical protein